MPVPARADDEADLLRVEMRDLRSTEWWRSLNLDGVVLYAWGEPRFRKIAAAIRAAGIFLILNQDSGGLFTPLAGPGPWWRSQFSPSRNAVAVVRALAAGVAGVALKDTFRAAHLRAGDVIACVSPEAVKRYRRICLFYGGRDLQSRVTLLPHPVEDAFVLPAAFEKAARIVCIGRWDDPVKRAPVLMNSLAKVLEAHSTVQVDVIGREHEGFQKWLANLVPGQRERVHVHGLKDRESIIRLLGAAQIYYCPSFSESFNIAAGEALCCGCSVVAGRSPSLPSFKWFAEEECGSLGQDDPAGHAAALLSELESWKEGRRDARRISSLWVERLHAGRIAERLVEMKRMHTRRGLNP